MSINTIPNCSLAGLFYLSFFAKRLDEKHDTSIRVEKYHLDFKKQLSAIANPYAHYQRAHKKIDRTKTAMGKEE